MQSLTLGGTLESISGTGNQINSHCIRGSVVDMAPCSSARLSCFIRSRRVRVVCRCYARSADASIIADGRSWPADTSPTLDRLPGVDTANRGCGPDDDGRTCSQCWDDDGHTRRGAIQWLAPGWTIRWRRWRQSTWRLSGEQMTPSKQARCHLVLLLIHCFFRGHRHRRNRVDSGLHRIFTLFLLCYCRCFCLTLRVSLSVVVLQQH